MANLYEIDERLLTLENYNVDNTTGEYLENDEFENKLTEVQMELDNKIEQLLCWYKNLLSESDAIDAEIERLKDRKKRKTNLAERLFNNVNNYFQTKCLDDSGELNLDKLNKHKFETSKVFASYRKSKRVEITDESLIPTQFKREEVTTKIDKKSLKTSLECGDVVGAKLVTNYNMQIK